MATTGNFLKRVLFFLWHHWQAELIIAAVLYGMSFLVIPQDYPANVILINEHETLFGQFGYSLTLQKVESDRHCTFRDFNNKITSLATSDPWEATGPYMLTVQKCTRDGNDGFANIKLRGHKSFIVMLYDYLLTN